VLVETHDQRGGLQDRQKPLGPEDDLIAPIAGDSGVHCGALDHALQMCRPSIAITDVGSKGEAIAYGEDRPGGHRTGIGTIETYPMLACGG
jgi:hypothetical protein